MEEYKISNSNLQVEVKSLGAELCSVFAPELETEYIWPGNPETWTGHSPVLFPIIGSLQDDTYKLHDKTYSMLSHGFARKTTWTLERQTPSSISFLLRSSELSKRQYPFDFSCIVSYTLLDETSLDCAFLVENRERTQELPFSIGAHPAFNCPLEANKKFEDYFLEFDEEEDTRRFMKDVLLTGHSEAFRTTNRRLPLKHSLFTQCAIILKDFKSREISLKTAGGQRSVKVSYPGFTHLGIWSYPRLAQDYVCIEPWFGVDPVENSSSDFLEKEGIIRLAAGKKFSCKYRMKFQ